MLRRIEGTKVNRRKAAVIRLNKTVGFESAEERSILRIEGYRQEGRRKGRK